MTLVGTRLGPYEIVAPLGAGAMGEVYRARDTRLRREVAIKVLPPHLVDSPDALARFEREARAVAALSHPNILALHDVGRDGPITFAVSELLEGETLRDVIARGPMPVRRALTVMAQIALGLGAAHERGIVHRDVKPENLFLTRDGRVKILDFGIASQNDGTPTTELHAPNLTQPGTMIGTPSYMAPEQLAAGPADARSDLFAFGMVAHELLTGVHPFKRKTLSETIAAVLRDDPAPLGNLNGALPAGAARVLGRCLEKSPADRPQSARDLGFYLDALATAPDVAMREPQPDITPLLRKRVFYASLATVLLIVAITWGYAGLMARRVVRETAAADVARAVSLVHRVHDERLAHLALTADLIASFPGFKALFQTDVATFHDFLVNHQSRVPGTPTLIALLPDGRVAARTDGTGAAPPAAGDTFIETLLKDDNRTGIVAIDGRVHHAARASSDAGGTVFGHVIAALPVGDDFVRTLSAATQEEIVLLSNHVVGSTLRGAQPPWPSLQAWRDAGGRDDRTIEISLGPRRFDAHEVVLSVQPPLSAIVAKSRDDTTAPWRRIQDGLVIVGLIGVAVAIAGAYWIARATSRPPQRL